MINLENKLIGYHVRLKELHFSAPSIDVHKLIDEFDSALLTFEDEVMENLQPLPNFGFIGVGELNPKLPKEMNFEDLLVSIRGTLADFKNQTEEVMYSGVNSIVDTFFAEVNKYIYLMKIVNK